METVDWSECPLVEVKPGVQSGAPVLRGTRMPVNAIVDNFDCGVSAAEIAEQFEIPPEQVEAILTYAKSHRIAHPDLIKMFRSVCAVFRPDHIKTLFVAKAPRPGDSGRFF